MWEALTIAALVAAFLAVAGLAGMTVFRLWTSTGTGTGTDTPTGERES